MNRPQGPDPAARITDEDVQRAAQVVCAHHCGLRHSTDQARDFVHGREARAVLSTISPIIDRVTADLRADLELVVLASSKAEADLREAWADLAALRQAVVAIHYQVPPIHTRPADAPEGWCHGCGQTWPCPAAVLASVPAGGAADQPEPRRYDQCGDDCTTDCGHCKGRGKPKRRKDSCAEHCSPKKGDYCGGPCLDDIGEVELVEEDQRDRERPQAADEAGA